MEDLKKYWIPIVIVFVFFMFYKPVIYFLILESLVLLIGFYSWRFIMIIKKTGIEGSGEILSYESDNDGHKTLIVEFTTKTGILHIN